MALHQIFDKENSSVNLLHPVTSRISAPRGKAFQGNQTPRPTDLKHLLSQKKSSFSETPRRALGDIRNTFGSSSTPLPKPSAQQKLPFNQQTAKTFSKPTSKPKPGLKKEIQNTRKLSTDEVKKTKVKENHAPAIDPWFLDEIEHMHIPDDEDDYEDIWPKCEQPATYLNKLLNWRPQNIVPLEDFEEKDDHICVLDEDDWELKVSDARQKNSFTQSNTQLDLLLEEPSFEDLAMPSLPSFEYVDTH